MGRLYQKTASGEKTLARFESGRVQSGMHTDAAVYYNSGGQIYHDTSGRIHRVVATCDTNGNIYKGSGGSAIAKCEDGIIYEGSRPDKVLAWYDGDMYGAAAAVIVVLGLDKQQ